MDDFNNSYTPSPQDDEIQHDPQPRPAEAAEPQQTAYQQTAAQQPADEQPGEARTPFQTPVQHPAYQAPREETFYSGPQPDLSGGAQPQPPQPPQRPKKKHGKAVLIGVCGVAAACLLFAGGAAVGNLFAGGSAPADSGESAETGSQPTVQINDTPELDPDNYDVVNGLAGEEIYKKVSPSIVSVLSTTASGVGSGSGVIMSADGYIITNDHVVDGAQSVVVCS